MSWTSVRTTLAEWPADPSPIVDIYLRHGIENTIEEPPALWGCFPDVNATPAQIAALRADLEQWPGAVVTLDQLEETNWDEVWRQHFRPRRVGTRFVVQPTWDTVAAEPGDLVITLDPGQAFGTGDHPTTRQCLALLEGVPVAGALVADVGCGSGILAIGARMLGACEVHALDIDPIAVDVTRENAARNRVEIDAFVGEGVQSLFDRDVRWDDGSQEWVQDENPLESRPEPQRTSAPIEPRYDIVISNIISAVLIRISPDVAAATKPGGHWIVSGIIEQNWDEVRRAAEAVGFELIHQSQEDDWCAATFRRSYA